MFYVIKELKFEWIILFDLNVILMTFWCHNYENFWIRYLSSSWPFENRPLSYLVITLFLFFVIFLH